MLAGFARWIGFLDDDGRIAGARAAGRRLLLVRLHDPDTQEVPLERNADGIVVLTGAAAAFPTPSNCSPRSMASGC